MIERVSQHQSRFRAPGLSPDVRGVALGPVGVVLLPSIERLVAFLRATGEEGALDELLESLRIVQVISPLRTRELLVEVQSSSSHRMDRLAAIARLVNAMVFTGSARHFVKYRDAQAPFGYDIAELIPEPGDIALYHDRFAQPYRMDKVIPLRDLLLRLALVSVPRARAESPRLLYALVRLGLGDAIVGYLARWSVGARVARVQWARGGHQRCHRRGLAAPARAPGAPLRLAAPLAPRGDPLHPRRRARRGGARAPPPDPPVGLRAPLRQRGARALSRGRRRGHRALAAPALRRRAGRDLPRHPRPRPGGERAHAGGLGELRAAPAPRAHGLRAQARLGRGDPAEGAGDPRAHPLGASAHDARAHPGRVHRAVDLPLRARRREHGAHGAALRRDRRRGAGAPRVGAQPAHPLGGLAAARERGQRRAALRGGRAAAHHVDPGAGLRARHAGAPGRPAGVRRERDRAAPRRRGGAARPLARPPGSLHRVVRLGRAERPAAAAQHDAPARPRESDEGAGG